jgi:predicted ATPase
MKTEISGTRKYIDGGDKPLKIYNLKKINVLFGKNGTGKSSFLRNLYQADVENYHLVVPERGGIEMKYNSGILDQENDNKQKKNARQRNYDPSYRNRAFSRATSILTSLGYKQSHGIESDVVEAEKITNLFRVLLPEFKVIFHNDAPFNLKIYRDIAGVETEITDSAQLSSGQSEALSLGADIITQAITWQSTDKVILIDEPDAHLHIDLESRFAIFINEIVDAFDVQILIATHSSALIASLLGLTQEVGIICLDENKNEIGAVKKSDADIFTNLLSIELALAVVLKRKIVIVEGNDDYLVWNQATRSQSFEDISLIQANGGDIVKYKSNAEKILTAVLENKKYGVTVLDGDNKNPPGVKDTDLIPFVRLGCYSLENLLLTNEVLSNIKENIDLDAELDALKNGEDISDDEKTQIEAIKKDKVNTKISKTLIKKIHNHIDEHSDSRDWRILVGKKIGSGRPSGELLKFLNPELVDYIWGVNEEQKES